jgi:hypothetical protein
LNEATHGVQRYTVEVSGWDHQEDFFVERTQLEWQDQNVKKVVLRNRVRRGAMVFLRLIEPLNPPSLLPVAYRVGQVISSNKRNCSEVDLEQLWPQHAEAAKCIDAPPAAAASPATRAESSQLESEAPGTIQLH